MNEPLLSARATPRVALVHDWLTGMRGGEKVLGELAVMYPEAPIFTLLHVPGAVSSEIESHPIRSSFIQSLPGAATRYRWLLPLFPWAIEALDLQPYELVISSSHCAAKAVLKNPRALHLCYCHTPMRYAWDQFESYFSPHDNGRIRYAAIAATMAWLRRWDAATVSRVDAFAANSFYVAGRIRRYYRRPATVIPPPVDTTWFTPDGIPPDPYYLIVSALSPYKRLDTAIEAFNRLRKRLVIVGWGPERRRLETMANDNIEFVGRVDDKVLRQLYRRCRALLLPGIEDAGIAPLEAMACGRPVVVRARGGAAESVVEGKTGFFIGDGGPEEIIEAVDIVERVSLNTDQIRAHAKGFAPEVFARRFRNFARGVLGLGQETADRVAEQTIP